MWVLIDVALSGLSVTSTRSPPPKPIFATKGERSDMLLLSRYSLSRLVKPDNDVMFEMLLRERFSHSRLVNADSVDKSVIELSQRFRLVKLVKPDNGAIFEMLLLERDSRPRLVKPDSGVMSEMLL